MAVISDSITTYQFHSHPRSDIDANGGFVIGRVTFAHINDNEEHFEG